MNDKQLMEKDYSFLKCDKCIFCENCEKMFNECPANFISDKIEDYASEIEFMHLKNCQKQEFDTLTEEQQKSFVKNVVEIYMDYQEIDSNIK